MLYVFDCIETPPRVIDIRHRIRHRTSLVMPLPSASEIAALRAFPLPPAKVLFTKRRIIKCLKIVALFDLYGDKILCGNPDTWAAVKQRLKANREPYAHMSADIYHKALEAIKE